RGRSGRHRSCRGAVGPAGPRHRSLSSSGSMSTGRTAIVTGGGSGIGLAISERLALEGAAVAIFDRDGRSAEEAAAKIAASGGTAIGITVDVTDRAQIDAGVEEVRGRVGHPTVLVNNAG